MKQSCQKLIGLPLYALLSGILGIISGSAEIVTGTIALNSSVGLRYGWDRLAGSLSVVFAGGVLILIGSLLIVLRKYDLGAILVLVPAIFSSLLNYLF